MCMWVFSASWFLGLLFLLLSLGLTLFLVSCCRSVCVFVCVVVCVVLLILCGCCLVVVWVLSTTDLTIMPARSSWRFFLLFIDNLTRTKKSALLKTNASVCLSNDFEKMNDGN